MLPVIDELSRLKYFPDIPQEMKDLVGPDLFIAVGRVYGGLFPGGPSMIPDRCTFRVDTRPQPGVPIEEVKAVIQRGFERAKASDREFALEMHHSDVKNSFEDDRNAADGTALKSGLESA